ncbi:hypothetical protein M3484_03005 [Pseudomonas sp. GX19020]|uniref:hypothetical protein n=1 Tax=Pseudomonas sp. GX19020 TaxID=2942277 RepID=UPI0020196932|nr:hypothetical protein [Pseudomonas sp. GX19020]MCL4065545.1 hypothetical protein [Pseudomonas sp. GX19020]
MRQATVLAMMAAVGISLPALPGLARQADNEVTGNWAGAAGDGFWFRAQLETEADLAALKIWNGMGAVPDGNDAPDLDVADFAVAAFATSQRLEVVETPDGSTLQVITEFADEEGEGREVVEIRFIDFQYTIVGYALQASFQGIDGPAEETQCVVDTLAGRVVENGRMRNLPPLNPEALNASGWGEAAAFERGWCSRSGEGS